MTKRILVTGTGGPAAVGLLNAWKNADVELLAADMDPCAAGLYLVNSNRRFIVPGAAEAGFVEHLVALCERHQVDILVPTVDAELLPLMRAQARFDAVGTTLMSAPLPALDVCLDKWALMIAASGVVPVPRSALLTTAFDRRITNGPLIIKPRRGSGGRGIERVDSVAKLHGYEPSEDLLVQAYLPGQEYSVDVLRLDQDHPVACVPRLRMKVDSGVAVASRTVHDPQLIDMARRITTRLGLTGIANVQFRRDADGLPRLLEINPRVPGTLALTVASGIDMPNLWLQHVMGEPVVVPTTFEEVAMVRTWQEHYMPADSMMSTADPALRKSA